MTPAQAYVAVCVAYDAGKPKYVEIKDYWERPTREYVEANRAWTAWDNLAPTPPHIQIGLFRIELTAQGGVRVECDHEGQPECSDVPRLIAWLRTMFESEVVAS